MTHSAAPRYRFHFDSGFEADFNQLLKERKDIALFITAFLQEAQESFELINLLSTVGAFKSGKYAIDCKQWERLSNKAKSVWRLKFLDVKDPTQRYRVIYDLDSTTRIVRLLGIKIRDDLNYDDLNDAFVRRIRQAASITAE